MIRIDRYIRFLWNIFLRTIIACSALFSQEYFSVIWVIIFFWSSQIDWIIFIWMQISYSQSSSPQNYSAFVLDIYFFIDFFFNGFSNFRLFSFVSQCDDFNCGVGTCFIFYKGETEDLRWNRRKHLVPNTFPLVSQVHQSCGTHLWR